MTSDINNFKSAISTTIEKQIDQKNTKAVNSSQKSSTAGITQGSISQNDFLNLLVHQLQNQDPLNPMENQEFAVQLATFSQLEQLVEINEKLENKSVGGAGEMAAYLGNEIAFSDNLIRVASGKGSNLMVDVPADTQSLRVDLLDENGSVAASLNYEGSITPGQQFLALENLDLTDGKYEPSVVAVTGEGKFTSIEAKATATVSGFVMEPEPSLLVDGEEIALSEVGALYKAP